MSFSMLLSDVEGLEAGEWLYLACPGGRRSDVQLVQDAPKAIGKQVEAETKA